MKSEPKYLDKTEACYEVEYDLRKDIHYRKGEILKLEHINAKHCREIERLNERITKIPETTPDVSDKSQDDTTKLKIQFAEYILRMFGLENMYEYENLHTRGEIELAFIDHRSDEDENAEDRHKIEFANTILHKFGIETTEKYEELVKRGDIDIDILDHRVPHPPKGL